MLHPIKMMEALSQAHVTNTYSKALGEHIKVLKNLNFNLIFSRYQRLTLQKPVEKEALDPKAEMYPWQNISLTYVPSSNI